MTGDRRTPDDMRNLRPSRLQDTGFTWVTTTSARRAAYWTRVREEMKIVMADLERVQWREFKPEWE